MSIFLLSIPVLGGLDQSGTTGANSADNLSINNLAALGLQEDITNAPVADDAPQMATTEPVNAASYTSLAPPASSQRTLTAFNIMASPPTSIFYRGNTIQWNGFLSTFPSNTAGMWIERATGWTWYATMPLGSWARELLYVPVKTPVTMYEVYSGRFVIKYNLGVFNPGYYLMWYYADMQGRHYNVFTTNSGNSNTVTIDVYSATSKPTPPNPDPKAECQKKSNCFWDDTKGECVCTAPNPVAECEKKPGCFWADGQCQCPPGPVPNPAAACESNPNCNYVNGQCLCRGVPGPMPGPVPNPTPGPMPGPIPNPTPDDSGNDMAGSTQQSS